MTVAGPDPERCRRLVIEALKEDGADDDRTTQYLGLAPRSADAVIVSQASGVIAGVGIARMVFEEIDGRIEFTVGVDDGAAVDVGDIVIGLVGNAGGLLAGERVALNFLQRLSGIATLTSRFVDAARGSGVTILDTRKTTPLHRELERYAVRVGGGTNHRFNLSDMMLIKENHRHALGGMLQIRERLAMQPPDLPVEVEVDSIETLKEIIGAPVDRIMLDNFTPDDVRTAIDMIRGSATRDRRPEIEVSGGIGLHNIEGYLIDGLDFISIGALTHSAPAFDLSMEVAIHGS